MRNIPVNNVLIARDVCIVYVRRAMYFDTFAAQMYTHSVRIKRHGDISQICRTRSHTAPDMLHAINFALIHANTTGTHTVNFYSVPKKKKDEKRKKNCFFRSDYSTARGIITTPTCNNNTLDKKITIRVRRAVQNFAVLRDINYAWEIISEILGSRAVRASERARSVTGIVHCDV